MIEISAQGAASPEFPSKTNRSSRKMQLPPRPPPPVEKEPPQVQQWASSEDLSFADFSALEEDEGKHTSLSGYLEEPKESYKISAVDVASVGNASDTLISGVSGRDLHERAKAAFNRADYKAALPLFEAILAAQVRRFSALHPSVGAAMHNVGVSGFCVSFVVMFLNFCIRSVANEWVNTHWLRICFKKLCRFVSERWVEIIWK